MQIFDENGTPVQPEPRVPEKGAIMCPNCGTMCIIADDVIASKTKPRFCAKCGEWMGEW